MRPILVWCAVLLLPVSLLAADRQPGRDAVFTLSGHVLDQMRAPVVLARIVATPESLAQRTRPAFPRLRSWGPGFFCSAMQPMERHDSSESMKGLSLCAGKQVAPRGGLTEPIGRLHPPHRNKRNHKRSAGIRPFPFRTAQFAPGPRDPCRNPLPPLRLAAL